jgi:hypothetical protein
MSVLEVRVRDDQPITNDPPCVELFKSVGNEFIGREVENSSGIVK